MERKWSQVEYLHETVKNPNIIIKGTQSYYSNAWGSYFEDDVVRYLYGDEHSRKNWQPQWELESSISAIMSVSAPRRLFCWVVTIRIATTGFPIIRLPNVF